MSPHPKHSRRPWLFAAALLLAVPAWADPDSDYKRGFDAYMGEDLITAMDYLRRASEGGHPRAMGMYGFILDRSEDNEEAARWYKRAAEAGDAQAMLDLSRLLSTGEGLAKDETKAFQWIEAAAKTGQPDGVLALSRVYQYGLGNVPRNEVKGLDLLNQAATLKFSPAMKELAETYRTGRLGLPKDLAKAQQWEAAIKTGNLPGAAVAGAAPPAAAPSQAAAAPSQAAAPPPAENDEISAAALTQATTAPPVPAGAMPAQAEVEQAVQQWAAAWSARDVNGYLGAYSGSFTPPDGAALAAWRATRGEKLQAAKFIQVEVANLKVQLQGDTAQASFTQKFQSDKVKDQVQKTLTLKHEGAGWKITNESSRK